jgi:hypothetical protein
LSAQFPLILEDQTLSFDGSKFKEEITKLVKTKLDAQTVANNFQWLNTGSVGGGAVGIYDDGKRVIKSVNDLNFKGSGVTVTRKGKQVDIEFVGGGGSMGATGPTGPAGSVGAQGITGILGLLYTYNSGVTGTAGGTGNITGNYDVNTPWGSGTGVANTLWISATDLDNITREPYYDFAVSAQNTGRTEVGQLYMSSYDRKLVSVYSIGDVSKLGSGGTAVFRFAWTTQFTATGGAFNNGERFTIFYIPHGRQGAKGNDAEELTSIDGGEITGIPIP